MATTDKLQKREKSRRVWRLNKKEGIPVMEALDSVGISKDVYYRIKNENEDKWQNEIITADELENKLEELQERVGEFEDNLSEFEERADKMESRAQSLSLEANYYERVNDMEDRMIGIENLLERADIDLDDVDDMEGVSGHERDIEEIKEYLQQFNQSIQTLDDRVNDIAQSQEKLESKVRKLEARDVPESVFDLFG
jgi:DNA repair exonuclease SbcCD ATPase subunit